MQGEHGDAAKIGCGGNGSGNGVRNVVELKIEEDFVTGARKPVNGSRAFGSVELAAHLE